MYNLNQTASETLFLRSAFNNVIFNEGQSFEPEILSSSQKDMDHQGMFLRIFLQESFLQFENFKVIYLFHYVFLANSFLFFLLVDFVVIQFKISCPMIKQGTSVSLLFIALIFLHFSVYMLLTCT